MRGAWPGWVADSTSILPSARDDDRVHVDLRRPPATPGGQPVRAALMASARHGRKNTLSPCRLSCFPQTLFAHVFDASPVAMALFARADGCCVAVNDAFARLLGYGADEIIDCRTELGLLDGDTWRLVGRTVVASVNCRPTAPGARS
jgi:PAS domain-containing protein